MLRRLFFPITCLASACSLGGDPTASELELSLEADDPPYVASSDGWSVTAHAPVLVDEHTVQGAMTFTRDSGAEARGGGVCLVADLHGNTPCETEADCASLPLPDEGFHYCAGVNGFERKRCWTRPGSGTAYCNRSPSRAPGTYATPMVPKKVDGLMVKWISYACLAVENEPGGCGSLDPSLSVKATSRLLDDGGL
jgi:hypothetical protein